MFLILQEWGEGRVGLGMEKGLSNGKMRKDLLCLAV